MLVKAHAGNGRWRLREVPEGRGLEWSTNLISVPCDDERGSVNWNYFADYRVADAESGELIVTPDGFVSREDFAAVERTAHPDAQSMRFFRWVKWDTGDGPHVLVTDGPVFLCNDRGDTVEALR